MENRANLVFLRLVLTEVCLITIYKLQYFFGENLLFSFFFLNTWKSIFRDQEKRIKKYLLGNQVIISAGGQNVALTCDLNSLWIYSDYLRQRFVILNDIPFVFM